MKRALSLLLILSSAVLHGATINLVCTNTLGLPDTNIVRGFPLATPINVNGQWTITGIPFRGYPNSTGLVSFVIPQGTYLLTNISLGQIVIAAPSGNGVYNAMQSGVLISGANTFNFTPGVFSLKSAGGTIAITGGNGDGTGGPLNIEAIGGGGATTLTSSNGSVILYPANGIGSSVDLSVVQGAVAASPSISVTTNGSTFRTFTPALTAAVTNQWRIDATNAAAAVTGSGVTNNQVLPGVPSSTNGNFAGTFTGPASYATNSGTVTNGGKGSFSGTFIGNISGGTNGCYLPVVNVLLSPYNADPFNTVDSTTAIQNAVNAVAASGGGGVYIPSGVYKVNSTINLLPNNSFTDSGNIGGATNRVEIFGDGQSSVLITTGNTTSPVFAYVGAGSAQVLWLHVHDLNMKGPFYTGGGHDNAGAITTSAYTSQAFFLGIPGVNTGTIAGAYSLFERMTVEWYNYGIVHSNWVGATIRDCNIQMNKTGDILLAHSDSNLIENNFLGMTGQQNFCTNHFAIWIIGTNPALEPNADSGNGTVIVNNECDGQILYGDTLVSLVYTGGDPEDASANACPYAFVLTNNCNATFIGPHCNFVTSNNTNRFVFHLCNTADGITVISPTFTGAVGQRNNWYRIDRSDNILYAPRIVGGKGFAAAQENLPASIDCLFNTNTWVVLPTEDVARWRNGTYPMEVGASLNQGVVCSTNTTKVFALDAYSATNGVNQVIGSGLTVAGSDLALMSYVATGSGNTLYFGKDYSDATKHSPDRIEWDYATVVNGPQNIAGYVDNAGALNWNHYIVPQSLLLNGGTAYMNGDTVAYGGSTQHGKMSSLGVFYGSALGLTNFEATTYQTNLFTGGNNLDFSAGNYQFATLSGNASIAGFANVPTGSTAGSVVWACLSVSNGAAGASTFSWPAGLVQFGTNTTTSVSIPSGKRWKGTFSVDPQGTNLCASLQSN